MSDPTLARARALIEGGDPAGAMALLAPLLAGGRADTPTIALAANAAILMRDHDRAIVCIEVLLQRAPQDAGLRGRLATAHNNRGARLREAARPADALADFERALVLEPRHPQAHYNRALALLALDRREQALNALRRHLAIDPHDAAALVQLARLQWREDGAAAVAALSALHDPDLLEAGIAVADELGRHGEPQAAAAYAALLPLSGHGRRAPGLRCALGAALVLPAIAESMPALQSARASFAAGLGRLESEWSTPLLHDCEPRLAQLAWSNFLLAYQGGDDLPLQSRFAMLVERAADAFRPQWRAPPDVPARARRRVGLLSSFWRECTVGMYFGCWIQWLSKAGYDVHLYQLGPMRDAETDRLAAQCAAFHFHEGDLESLVERLRADALDLLLLPEYGMDPRLTPIAALRSARRQAVAWGHPVTTGFGTFDAFIGCGDMEPPGAASHYREPLRLLPGLGIEYRRPRLPAGARRDDLGLPDGALVLLPHSLFKLHPDLDDVMAALALRAPQVCFVLFEGELPQWRSRYVARLRRAFAAAGAGDPRLHWVARGPRGRFLAVVRACDLVLDPPHWSGGNATLDALQCGRPVVTLPGRFMRGRQSAAMLRRLGLADELCAPSAARAAELAADLLADPAARGALAGRIEAGLPDLFDAAPARAAFLAHIDGLTAR